MEQAADGQASGASCAILHAVATEPDSSWAVLVGVLKSFALVSDRQPVGLIVSAERNDGTRVVVEIVMTPDEWDDLVSITFGVLATAAQYVRELVLEQPSTKRYLVYSMYNLVPLDSPALPLGPDVARLHELAAQHPDGIPGAAWYAYRPDES